MGHLRPAPAYMPSAGGEPALAAPVLAALVRVSLVEHDHAIAEPGMHRSCSAQTDVRGRPLHLEVRLTLQRGAPVSNTGERPYLSRSDARKLLLAQYMQDYHAPLLRYYEGYYVVAVLVQFTDECSASDLESQELFLPRERTLMTLDSADVLAIIANDARTYS